MHSQMKPHLPWIFATFSFVVLIAISGSPALAEDGADGFAKVSDVSLDLFSQTLEVGPGIQVQLKFENVPHDMDGTPVRVTVFRNQQEWSQATGIETEIGKSPISEAFINNAPLGEVGISAYLDSNKNGRFDRNFLGLPEEPWALSGIGSNAPMGPPSWNAIRIQIQPNKNNVVPLYIHFP